jgi:hypothetical protein
MVLLEGRLFVVIIVFGCAKELCGAKKEEIRRKYLLSIEVCLEFIFFLVINDFIILDRYTCFVGFSHIIQCLWNFFGRIGIFFRILLPFRFLGFLDVCLLPLYTAKHFLPLCFVFDVLHCLCIIWSRDFMVRHFHSTCQSQPAFRPADIEYRHMEWQVDSENAENLAVQPMFQQEQNSKLFHPIRA